jgi:hypothetical protein
MVVCGLKRIRKNEESFCKMNKGGRKVHHLVV